MEDEPLSIKTNTRIHLHAIYTVQSLQLRTVEIQCIAQKISRSYFITVHVDEITVLFLLEKNGFRTKKTVYPSFQHKTDYPYATFDKMVCPSYT